MHNKLPSRCFTTIFGMLATILICSCSYEPEGMFDNGTSDKIDPLDVTINDLKFNDSQIYLYKNSYFYPQFPQGALSPIENYRVSIDNSDLSSGNYANGMFYLDANQISDGEHLLTLEIISKSNTGSIADKIGYEKLVLKKSWKLIVDRNYWSRATSSVREGYLNLSWPPYLDNDFKSYRVIRSNYQVTSIINNFEKSEYTDSSYVGELASFKVEIIKKDGSTINWGEYNFKEDIPQLSVTESNCNKTSIVWNKTPYYSALKSYQIIERNGNNYTVYATVSDPNVTNTLLEEMSIGTKLNLTLLVVPKNKKYCAEYGGFISDYYQQIYAGAKFNQCWNIHSINNEDISYFTFDDHKNEYNVYSSLSLNKTATKPIEYYQQYVTYSSDGSIVYLENTDNNTIEFRNSKTFELIRSIPRNAANMPTYYRYNIIDKDNLLLSNYSNLYAYNITNNKTIAEFKMSSYNQKQIVSKDGTYFIIINDSTQTFKIKDNKIILLNSFSSSELSPDWFEFNAIKSNELVVWQQFNKLLTVKNIENGSTISEYNFPYEWLQNIDYYRDELLACNGDYLYILDLYSGKIKHKTPISNSNIGYKNSYLFNHKIYFTEGVMYYIN